MTTEAETESKSSAITPARRDCAILVVLWLIMLASTMPRGNFPLNDDWNYAVSVKTLLDEHRLIVTHWSLAASLPHIILGWLTTCVAGFSFDALRAVSMVGGLVSAIFTYLLALRANAPRMVALLAGVTWMTNPLLFDLSTTFMTDVTFIMLAGASILFFAKVIAQGKMTWSAAIFAGLLAILTCLTRQTGLVISLGFMFACLFSKQWRGLKPLIPALIGIAAVVVFQNWLDHYVGPLQSYRVERAWIEQLLAKGPAYVMSNTMSNLIAASVYLGLFLFPLLVSVFPRVLQTLEGKEKRSALIFFAEPVILLAVGLIMTHSLMPLGDNVLFNLGLGPVLLGGEGPAKYVTAPSWFWIIVTMLGVLGAGGMLSLLLLAGTRSRTNFLYSFLLWTCFLYMAVIGFRGFFDRYLIFPLFIILPIVSSLLKNRQAEPPRFAVLTPISALLLLLYASFSIAGTHDYFAWNQARWQAAHDLVDVQQISPMEIDGGLEFNGWYSYDPRYRDNGGVVLSGNMKHNDEYVIAMQPMPNYEVLSRYSFQRWLPWGSGEILVLHEVH